MNHMFVISFLFYFKDKKIPTVKQSVHNLCIKRFFCNSELLHC